VTESATQALEILAVPTVAVATAALARRSRLAPPLLLVVVGLVGSVLPGVPELELDPEIVLYVFLPPLLFAAAWESSYFNLRANLKHIVLLSVGLVLFTALAVGYTAHWLVPGLPLAAGFVLGAIVSPPDAVAAVSIARDLGLPRRVVTILTGESLFNDATALTAFAVAVAATAGEQVGPADSVLRFCYSALVGAIIGLVLGPALHWLRGRLDSDPIVETSVILLAPFAAYLLTELAHASGVIAVVVTGLYLGHTFPGRPGRARLFGQTFWKILTFVLESVVFLLIGLQLPTVLRGVADLGWWRLTGYAAAVFAVTVVCRFAWVMLLTRAGTRPSTAISWAGMRGVVSLAAAFAIPLTVDDGGPFPQRDLLLFLTFTTVLASLLLQGLSFPGLIRRLGIDTGAEQRSDLIAEASAKHRATSAAIDRLEELSTGADAHLTGEIVDKLRDMADHHRLRVWERIGDRTGQDGDEIPDTIFRRLRLEMLAAERASVIAQWRERRIDEEVLFRLLRDLDLEETLLGLE
jgi:CPA1 family monovalent cation:H+ antiporter